MTSALDRVSASPRERRNFASLPEVLPLPNLIQTQIDSFKWFCEEGLQELFAEISPIQDFAERPRPPVHLERVPRAEVLGRRVPDARPHVQQAAVGASGAGQQGDRRGQRAGRLPRRLPLDDRQGHLSSSMAPSESLSDQLGAFTGRLLNTEIDDPTTGRQASTAKAIPNRGAGGSSSRPRTRTLSPSRLIASAS